MKSFAFLDDDGYPTRLERNLAVPDGAVELPSGLSLHAVAQMVMAYGTWWARPASPGADLLNGTILIEGCPEGATAEVTDVALEDHLATVLSEEEVITLELPDPGTYRIEIDFGKPYLRTTTIVEVPE